MLVSAAAKEKANTGLLRLVNAKQDTFAGLRQVVGELFEKVLPLDRLVRAALAGRENVERQIRFGGGGIHHGFDLLLFESHMQPLQVVTTRHVRFGLV